jgi:1-acyl-sn-glycerol-3-phosphate acyltransferase
MTVLEFQEQLRTTGCYSTPAPARQAPLHLATTWRFHVSVMSQFIISGFHAHIGRFDTAAMARRSFRIMRSAEKLGAVVTFEGFLPRAVYGGPVVYAANHMSMLETMLLPEALSAFTPLAIVLKESLLHYPGLGPALRALKPIVVSRHDARADLKAVLDQGRARLAAGVSVLIFPQSTRMTVFQPTAFNSLATKLAQAAQVPLTPIALRTDFVGLGRWLKDFGAIDVRRPVRFVAGAPIPPTTPPRVMQQQCVAFIATQLAQWGMPVATPAAHPPATSPEP